MLPPPPHSATFRFSRTSLFVCGASYFAKLHPAFQTSAALGRRGNTIFIGISRNSLIGRGIPQFRIQRSMSLS
nr:MAG TPA: hypothetical protein [Caudoviricetes sp.]